MLVTQEQSAQLYFHLSYRGCCSVCGSTLKITPPSFARSSPCVVGSTVTASCISYQAVLTASCWAMLATGYRRVCCSSSRPTREGDPLASLLLL